MFPFKALTDFVFSADEASDPQKIAAKLFRFKIDLYDARPFTNNDGGMGIESSFFVWEVINKIRPRAVVESGVWKGFTTYLFNQTDSVDSIYCFDPVVKTPGFVEYKSPKAIYFDIDWATPHFSFIDPSSSLAFFDDHQDQLERLLVSYARGYKYVLFDDNYFYGGGGHNGLATYMRKSPDLLDLVTSNIWIAPPMVFDDKGLYPVFSSHDCQLNSEIESTIRKENNYNWLTLVELKQPSQFGLSQIPDSGFIIDTYGRHL